CVFPWCTRPSRAFRAEEHHADCDHITPYRQAGRSCSCNLAPLCRKHHRAKTHGGWSYTPLDRGSYVWTSPHGYQFLRDQHGTLDVSHDRRDRYAHPPHLPQPPDL
ncbi:MAG TPA: HNH endonuclease signature motif containing protein, partial [Nocardioides sp.]|nr:HNH endonuclease signature motif containing protein [Nocardioides sp.]